MNTSGNIPPPSLLPPPPPLLLEVSNNRGDHQRNTNVPEQIQQNLQELIKHYPDGLWMQNLPIEYMKMFGDALNYTDYLYPTLESMCLSLDFIFKFEQPQADSSEIMLYDIYSEEYCEGILDQLKFLCLPDNIDIPQRKRCVLETSPGKVLHFKQKIPLETIDSNSLNIMIAEINDLSKFWFILSHRLNILNYLEFRLRRFYKNRAEEYIVPTSVLQTGLFVVVTFGVERYQRGVIVRGLPYIIKVFCVDVGSVVYVDKQNVFLMHVKFSCLPRQALRGRLFSLWPKIRQAPWDASTSYRFLKLVRLLPLEAEIKVIDKSQKPDLIFEMVLRDTSSRLSINDRLRNEHFAVGSRQEQFPPIPLPNGYECLVENIHLFPTFNELEQGLVPNAKGLHHMLATPTPIYHIFPNYFKFPDSPSYTPRRAMVPEISNSPREEPPVPRNATVGSQDMNALLSSYEETTKSLPDLAVIISDILDAECPSNDMPALLDDSDDDIDSVILNSALHETNDFEMLDEAAGGLKPETVPNLDTELLDEAAGGFDYQRAEPSSMAPPISPMTYHLNSNMPIQQMHSPPMYPMLRPEYGFVPANFYPTAGSPVAVWPIQPIIPPRIPVTYIQHHPLSPTQRMVAIRPPSPTSVYYRPPFIPGVPMLSPIPWNVVRGHPVPWSYHTQHQFHFNMMQSPNMPVQENNEIPTVSYPNIISSSTNVLCPPSDTPVSYANGSLNTAVTYPPQNMPHSEIGTKIIILDFGAGLRIPIIRLTGIPSIVPISLQKQLTGITDPLGIRQYLLSLRIIYFELNLSCVNLRLREQLLHCNMIEVDQTTIQCISIEYLQEVMGFILKQEFIVPMFKDFVKMLSNRHPIWVTT